MMAMNTLGSKARLYSGVVLLFFIVTHFINHAVGLFGHEALHTARTLFITFWRSPPLWPVFPLALMLHVGLALGSVLKRRTLNMSAAEYLRLAMGLLGPTILMGHLTQTRIMNWHYGVDDTYAWVIAVAYPVQLWMLTVAALLLWGHGCLGIYFILRLKPWFERVRWLLFIPVLLLPTLAIAGAWVAAREINQERSHAQWTTLLFEQTALTPERFEEISLQLYMGTLAVMMGMLALAFIGRFLWLRVEKARGQRLTIQYVTGQNVEVPCGTSILEASRLHAIPHASICGGRGRCSTCRVRVVFGADRLNEASGEERTVLNRIKAPPGVRLACQTRPEGDVVIARLLHNENETDAFSKTAATDGREQSVAILFADLRGFTQLSENRMAYDVVFLLNEYFARMGQDIEDAGGFVDKFIGDGVMAIFGIRTNIDTACQQALRACASMSASIDILNERLGGEVHGTPLRLGIGVHGGKAVIGEMGYKAARRMTAIGDVVNTASRLESLCKEYQAQVILSDFVVQHSGLESKVLSTHNAAIRGKAEPLKIWSAHRASALK